MCRARRRQKALNPVVLFVKTSKARIQKELPYYTRRSDWDCEARVRRRIPYDSALLKKCLRCVGCGSSSPKATAFRGPYVFSGTPRGGRKNADAEYLDRRTKEKLSRYEMYC